MKLPSYEKDHYELDNAEEIHREYPDTFWIPETKKRESIEVGDVVKLIFRMEETKGSDAVSVERMWVEVTKINLPFYIGRLDNNPYGSECVVCDQMVTFKPCHIIEINDEP